MVSKQVQSSCNITFDESDTKLYPILDEEDDETASLEGENQKSKPQPTATAEPITPQTTIVSLSAEPISEPRQAPEQFPDQIMNDPAAKEKALVSHEVIMELQNYREAIEQKDAPMLMTAIQIKMDQHQEIRTWELIELPPDRMAIGCWLVYTVKTKPNREFKQPLARVIAQGFTQ